MSHRIWEVVLSFLSSRNFLIPSLTSSLTTDHGAKCCSASSFWVFSGISFVEF
jgi:hypothetical protein